MGMPSTESRRWSVEDVWALPDDGNRYETVDGELLVSPAPRLIHQHVVGAIHLQLGNWVQGPGKRVWEEVPDATIIDSTDASSATRASAS